MGEHAPAAEPFYKAITSKDIRDYKTIKHRFKIHFRPERGTELMCHHLCCVKLQHGRDHVAIPLTHPYAQAVFKCMALTLKERDPSKLFSVCLMGCELNMCSGFCPQVVCLQTDSKRAWTLTDGQEWGGKTRRLCWLSSPDVLPQTRLEANLWAEQCISHTHKQTHTGCNAEECTLPTSRMHLVNWFTQRHM